MHLSIIVPYKRTDSLIYLDVENSEIFVAFVLRLVKFYPFLSIKTAFQRPVLSMVLVPGFEPGSAG